MESSCEIPGLAGLNRTKSIVIRSEFPVDGGQPFRWLGLPISQYKASGDHHRGVTRTPMVGEFGEQTAFHMRYFEIAPGGYTSLEHHEHEHVVFVIRGRGEVILDGITHELGFGDVVYISPHTVHQLTNATVQDPFGFLCMVNANRDRPVLVTQKAK